MGGSLKLVRRISLIATPVVIAVSLVGLTGLRTTTDTRSLFSPDDKHYQELLEFEDTFAPYTSLLIVIKGDDEIFKDPNHAIAHSDAADMIASIENCVGVASLANLPVNRSDTASLSTIPALQVKDGVVQWNGVDSPHFENLTYRLTVSTDKKHSAVKGFFALDTSSPEQVKNTNQQVSYIISRLREKHQSLEFYATGGLVMMSAFDRIAQSDLSKLLPIVFLVIATISYFLLGSVALTAVLLAQSTITVVITMGALGFHNVVLNSATSSIPVIVFAISFAMTMHLLLHIVRSNSMLGRLTTEESILSAVKSHIAPMALTTCTTVVGMMSLAFVPSPPIRTLGIAVSIGSLASFVVAVSFVPALASLMKAPPQSNAARWLQSLVNSQARRIETKQVSLIVSSAVLLVCTSGLLALRVDDDFVEYFSEDTDFSVATRLATNELVGPYNVEILVTNKSDESLVSRMGLSLVGKIHEEINSHSDVVIRSFSLLDQLEPIRDAVYNAQTPLLDLSDEEIAQLYLAYELSLSKELSSISYVSSDRRSLRLSAYLEQSTSKEIQSLVSTLEERLQHITPSSVALSVTGESVPTAFLSEKNIMQMLKNICISLLLSSLLLGLFFRDLRLCAITFASIALPVIAGFGLWGWLFGTIGLAATVVVAVAVGIVIDDSIHLIYRYRDGVYNLDLNPDGAAAYAVHRAGVAIAATTVILSSAFLVLCASSFELNVSLGLATSILLVLALVFDITLLPRLLQQTS